MNIITITENMSMRGQYEVSIKRSGNCSVSRNRAYGIGEAAAKAMELANGCGGKYQILGSNDVLKEIRNGGIIGGE